jgi:hypothetical protein
MMAKTWTVFKIIDRSIILDFTLHLIAANYADDPGEAIKQAAWVADKFHLSRRRDKLSWSHHEEVAKFEPEVQDAWLDLAAPDNKPTTAQLVE